MENTKYDDKFYRLPKRLFKDEQFRSMTNEEKAHNLIYRSHQGLGKPNKIYVYDLLKADNSNWLPKQFKHRKGRTNEKEIL